MPFFPTPDDEEAELEGDPKDRVVHVRLIPILWLWVRHEAKRTDTNPSEWIRQAIADFDGSGAEDNRGKVVHVRVDATTWDRIRKETKSEGRTKKAPAEWVRCAINHKLMGKKR